MALNIRVNNVYVTILYICKGHVYLLHASGHILSAFGLVQSAIAQYGAALHGSGLGYLKIKK